MTDAALMIPVKALPGFSETTRRELLAYTGLALVPIDGAGLEDVASIPPATVALTQEDGPPDLTVALARKLGENVSDKTTAALRAIASSDTPAFHMKDVITAVPGAETYSDLRGVWSGITRRTRKILDDSEASLIWWEGDGIFDGEENYVDHIGRVSPLTHQSLRAFFGIKAAE